MGTAGAINLSLGKPWETRLFKGSNDLLALVKTA